MTTNSQYYRLCLQFCLQFKLGGLLTLTPCLSFFCVYAVIELSIRFSKQCLVRAANPISITAVVNKPIKRVYGGFN